MKAFVMKNWLRVMLKLAMALSFSNAMATQPLYVAAAADLAPCIDELNARFTQEAGGADIKVSIGSSGGFFAQIRNGAPFEVFLSADTQYPLELAKSGMADPQTLYVYAFGQLMMWSADTHLNVDAGLSLLKEPRIERIAIANPDLAPYGRAAKAALEKAGLWNAVQGKLVIGENIRQTAQFVQTGNAQIGFVSATHLANIPPGSAGVAWRVPAELYSRIEQGAIVTAKGSANPLASKYVKFLKSDAARAVLRKYGFTLPEVFD